MPEFLRVWLTLPTAPATLLLALVVAYWMFVIIGALDLDLFHFDLHLDVDVDGHESFADWGMVGLKWFNLGDVPLMVWVTAFGLPMWLASVILDRNLSEPTTQQIVTAVLRNAGIGLVAAKILTAPLKGKLKHVEPNPAADLVGRTCVIMTGEATPTFGQAQIDTTDGAPLTLTVRTTGGSLAKGMRAEIVDYAPELHVYYVRGET
jgi:hypothetical protein